MEVRAGWATDYGHLKYDVSADETDLARILLAAGVSAPFHDKVTAEEAWALLDAEARWLAEHALARYFSQEGNGPLGEKAEDRSRGAVKDRQAALAKLRTRLGLQDQPEEPSDVSEH